MVIFAFVMIDFHIIHKVKDIALYNVTTFRGRGLLNWQMLPNSPYPWRLQLVFLIQGAHQAGECSHHSVYTSHSC